VRLSILKMDHRLRISVLPAVRPWGRHIICTDATILHIAIYAL
jgi:hypothetical protein